MIMIICWTRWKYEGIQLEISDQNTCRAPCVVEIDNCYYMYYSSIDSGCQDEHGHIMREEMLSYMRRKESDSDFIY